jgi:hypothetical protein
MDVGMDGYRDLDRRVVVDQTELDMLRRLQELVNELMLETEEVKDEDGSLFVNSDILEQMWEQNREYNEYVGPAGTDVM